MRASGTAVKLGGFGLALVVAFAAAYGVGQAVGPVAAEPEAASDMDGMAGHGPDAEAGGHEDAGGHGADGHGGEGGGIPAGLMISADGYTLDVLDRTPAEFSFRVLDADHEPVTRFEPNHDKLMHLIVARRDLSGFRHVHPTMTPDGTWRVPLTFDGAGDHRVFADFLPEGGTGNVTLGADVHVPGAYQPRPLPAPATTAAVDGYTVTLGGHLDPGGTSKLALTVRKDGVPVTDLEPYLGAYGHLVVLRQGDLAYLHVHPEETGTAGPAIILQAEVPSAGTYRMYLDFKHGGKVRTAELTAVAEPHH